MNVLPDGLRPLDGLVALISGLLAIILFFSTWVILPPLAVAMQRVGAVPALTSVVTSPPYLLTCGASTALLIALALLRRGTSVRARRTALAVAFAVGVIGTALFVNGIYAPMMERGSDPQRAVGSTPS